MIFLKLKQETESLKEKRDQQRQKFTDAFMELWNIPSDLTVTILCKEVGDESQKTMDCGTHGM